MPINENDYTKEAIKNRILQAQQGYVDSGDSRGLDAATRALQDLDLGENPREVELNFNGGDIFQEYYKPSNNSNTLPPDENNSNSFNNQGVSGDTQNSVPEPDVPVPTIDPLPDTSSATIDTTPDENNSNSFNNQGVSGDTQNSVPEPGVPVQTIDPFPDTGSPTIDTTPLGSPETDTTTVADN